MANTSKQKQSSGFGVGSASIVLIFAVLCLTIFTLITYIVAGNYKSLVDTEAQMVTAYYKADALAVDTLDWMLSSGARSGANHNNIEVLTAYNETAGADTSYYFCPVTDTKFLYVNVYFHDTANSNSPPAYDILSWHMVDISDWSPGGGMNVWSGE